MFLYLLPGINVLREYLVHVEDKIELADIFEAFVERFHEDLDKVQDSQLGLGAVHTEHKVQGGIVTVYQLVVCAPDQTENT
jgi:hypothetical protein